MGKSKSTQTQTTDQNSNTVTPGTVPATQFANVFKNSGLETKALDASGYTGDRVAAPISGDYVANWGAAPSTFVPQRTATDAPQQTAVSYVNPNAQEGIDAGLAAAGTNQTALAPIVGNMYDYWNSISAGGGQNPYLQSVIDSFTTDFNEQQARNAGQRALYAGADGAFGGTPFQQAGVWAEDQANQQYAGTVAGLRYDDFRNTQGMLADLPGQVADVAALSQIPAEQFARYGGMRQQNLAGAAAAGDENAQRLQNNLWQAQTLNDQNAVLAAKEAIAQWEAQYRIDSATVQENAVNADITQQQNQAGLDNPYLQWLSDHEATTNALQNSQMVQGVYGAIPGSTGTSHGTSTTTQTEQAAPWQIAAGLGGAAMQAFSPGGFFSGGLSALGKAAGSVGDTLGRLGTQNLYGPSYVPQPG